MSRRFLRSAPVPGDVVTRACLGRGEKVLAGCPGADGEWLLGTRDAFVVVPAAAEPVRLPWEQVESADWSRDDDRLRVHEVGVMGQRRAVHTFTLDDPGPLLPLVRERVTASVVLQRRVVVDGRRGFFVVARRAPHGTGEITFAWEFDPGVDPGDPQVRDLAEAGLRAAEEELGLG